MLPASSLPLSVFTLTCLHLYLRVTFTCPFTFTLMTPVVRKLYAVDEDTGMNTVVKRRVYLYFSLLCISFFVFYFYSYLCVFFSYIIFFNLYFYFVFVFLFFLHKFFLFFFLFNFLLLLLFSFPSHFLPIFFFSFSLLFPFPSPHFLFSSSH